MYHESHFPAKEHDPYHERIAARLNKTSCDVRSIDPRDYFLTYTRPFPGYYWKRDSSIQATWIYESSHQSSINGVDRYKRGVKLWVIQETKNSNGPSPLKFIFWRWTSRTLTILNTPASKSVAIWGRVARLSRFSSVVEYVYYNTFSLPNRCCWFDVLLDTR